MIPGTPRTCGRSTTIKRAMKHVGVFALLGVVTSYLVAWGLLIGSEAEPWGAGRTASQVSEAREHVTTVQHWHAVASDVSSVEITGGMRIPSDEGPFLEMAPWNEISHWWMRDQLDTASTSIDGTVDLGLPIAPSMTWIYAVGWPMRSARSLWRLNEKSSEVQGAWRLSWNSDRRLYRYRSSLRVNVLELPYLPLWRGLTLNSIFFGALLWLLWFGPGMLRRGSRRRRGLCVRCGYDLRGRGDARALCPECGAT
jgi:hypothetical protein